MSEKQSEKPKVEYTSSGVLRVKAKDLLLSVKGQRELAKAAEFAKQHGLRRNPQR